MPTKKLLAAAAMTASLVGGGVAGAALFTPVLSGAQETTDDQTDESEADETTGESEADDTDGRFGAAFHHGPGLPFRHVALEVAAEALGVTEDELRDRLEDGETIAEVADAEGVDVQTVIDALVADATGRIDEGVAELKENLPQHMTDLVNGELPSRPHRLARRAIALDVAADALGVTDDELRDALRSGDSIADVAEDEGVEVQTVVDALVADATARIDEAVADGDIDAEDAEELKAELPDRIAELVERDGPFGPHRHRWGPAGR